MRMRIRLGRWLLVWVACTCIRAPLSAAEEKNPYPFGKAEFQARQIADVLELTRRADQYRAECVRLFASEQPLPDIEHFGREAKNWYRSVLEREPSNAYASLCIGYIDLIIGRAATNRTARSNSFAAAMSRFREALEKRPGYAEAYLYMAQVHALRGEYAEAEKNLRLILNSGIENSHIHSWMAYILIQTKRKPEARVHIERAIELDDPSPSAQWSRQNQDAVAGVK